MSHTPKLPVRSMTGYAASQTTTDAGEISVVLRCVNGRNLDLHFHLGADFAAFENSIRTLLKAECARGHLEVRLSFQPLATQPASALQREQLGQYLRAFAEAKSHFALSSEPDLNQLLALPGVLAASLPERRTAPLEESAVLSAVRACVNELNRVREREGAALVEAIKQLASNIQAGTDQIKSIRTGAISELQTRLHERLQALLTDASISLNRLAEEAAFLADRSDIAEELTRLDVHGRELVRILEEGGQVGKRLDFLLQELNREANTVLSKTSGVGESGLGVTNLALGLKANIERIREQNLNLE